jgi:hypothetical protein
MLQRMASILRMYEPAPQCLQTPVGSSGSRYGPAVTCALRLLSAEEAACRRRCCHGHPIMGLSIAQ